MIKVLFVCLGNICRSPTAHGVLEQRVQAQGLENNVFVDSAGTGDWHSGDAPDSRATAAAKKRGIHLEHLRARVVTINDFNNFNYILAMDDDNLSHLKAMAPLNYQADVMLFLPFDKEIKRSDVPDPYYGKGDGFDYVLDLVSSAADGFLKYIIHQHKL